MVRMLNTTGSFYVIGYNYYSYNTQLTGYFADEFWYNNTYYSATTRKHQAALNRYYIDVDDLHTLNHCSYGNQDWSECIKDEIDTIKYELNNRFKKRFTKKNCDIIQHLLKKQLYLISVLDRVKTEV